MNIKEIFERDLRGHDYIKAFNLTPQVVANRVKERRQSDQLPRVQRLIASWGNSSIQKADHE